MFALLCLRFGLIFIGEKDGEVVALVAGAAFVGERGALEVDDVAFGVGEGVGGEGDEAGAGEGVEVDVELLAVDAEGEVGVELSGGAWGRTVEGAEDGAELAVFLCSGLAEGLGGGSFGRAEVAVAAGAEAVGSVAEVLDEGGHAALRSFGVASHGVDLGAAKGELSVVAGLPDFVFCCAKIAGDVEGGCALGDEFFGGAVEGLDVHAEALAESVGLLKVFGEDAGEAGEFGGCGVVALEEEVVHLAVGEGVEEHGARGIAVASCAADLLVVGLDGAGKSGVNDGADVGLVDAHAEGDGGDDDLELAGEEVALHALARGRVETGVIGGGTVRRVARRVLRLPCVRARRRWRGGLRQA